MFPAVVDQDRANKLRDVSCAFYVHWLISSLAVMDVNLANECVFECCFLSSVSHRSPNDVLRNGLARLRSSYRFSLPSALENSKSTASQGGAFLRIKKQQRLERSETVREKPEFTKASADLYAVVKSKFADG